MAVEGQLDFLLLKAANIFTNSRKPDISEQVALGGLPGGVPGMPCTPEQLAQLVFVPFAVCLHARCGWYLRVRAC